MHHLFTNTTPQCTTYPDQEVIQRKMKQLPDENPMASVHDEIRSKQWPII